MVKIPMPPSVNSYWATVANRRIISRSGRKYKKLIAQQAMVEQWEKFGDARVIVRLYMHDDANRKSDLDNYIKSLFDAITYAGVWDDDSQVDGIVYYRGKKAERGDRHMRILIMRTKDCSTSKPFVRNRCRLLPCRL